MKRFTGLSELDTVGETAGLKRGGTIRDDGVQMSGLRIVKIPDRKILNEQIRAYVIEQGFMLDHRSFLVKGQPEKDYIVGYTVRKMWPREDKQEAKSSLE